MADPVSAYFEELRDIRSTGAGVKETSYFGALANLLNEVGKGIKPRVRCILTLANRGAGLPDGGLFTPDQFQRSESKPLPGQAPARGVVEVKGTGEKVDAVADTEQVIGYFEKAHDGFRGGANTRPIRAPNSRLPRARTLCTNSKNAR